MKLVKHYTRLKVGDVITHVSRSKKYGFKQLQSSTGNKCVHRVIGNRKTECSSNYHSSDIRDEPYKFYIVIRQELLLEGEYSL